MARLTRQQSKARTRARLMAEAGRLFLEKGYAAASLEEIAEAAEVTKGAIYRHFESKEALLISLLEATASYRDISGLADQTRPAPDRFADLGRAVGGSLAESDIRVLAVILEMQVAALRNPSTMEVYRAHVRKSFDDFVASHFEAADVERLGGPDQLLTVLVVTQALQNGLREYQAVMPEVVTTEVFARAYSLLAGLFPDSSESATEGRVSAPTA
ncbi:MAG: TetR/AcrR family transcriptional regulator [Acidimicrobiales bacterium]